MTKEQGIRLFNTITDAYRHKSDRDRIREYLKQKNCYLTTTNKFPNGGLDTIESHEFEADNQITGGLKAVSLKKDGTITFKAYTMLNDEMVFEIFDAFVHNMLAHK